MKIMIADDHKILREGLKYMIENNSNYRVEALAENGLEAIQLMTRINIDFVIMDLNMPVLSGVEAIKEIRKTHNSVKILVLTALGDNMNLARAMNEGADGYVLKNISAENLILSIQSIAAGMEIVDKDVFKSNSNITVNGIEKNFSKIHLTVNGSDVIITEKELQIIKMIVELKTIPEIASELFLAEGRVRNIISELISKLNLQDKTHLAIFAIKSHLV